MARAPLALLLALGACASRASVSPRLEHDHGNAMVTLQIRSDAVTPNPDITIPIYSAVCWYHAGASGTPITIELDRSPGVCGSCATILGFGVTADGKALTKARVTPSSVALICFHESGEFHYTVSGLPKPLAGTIRVVGQKGAHP